MKARLYRATGEARNYIDGYSLYLPYPEWMKKESNGVTGIYLGCSPASDGTMIRCTWEEWNLRYGNCTSLGRKVDIDLMPYEFRKECRRIEALWNEALAKRDFSRFDAEA